MENLVDIYKKASLVMKPAAMKEGKLYSQQPHSGDGDFTFSRANGTQTRINKHGLIETVADNTPRLSYELDSNGNVGECPHLLLEPSRNNECLYSNTLSSWSELSGGSLQTITDNDAIAPDGSLTASTITFTGTGISLLRQFTNKAYTSSKHSSSFYAKKISGNGSVFFGITDTETEFTPTDEWVRYELNNVTPTDFGTNLFLDLSFDCTEGDKIAIWGAQIEEGAYSTSIIPTSGLAVARTADTCGDAGDVTIIKAEGSLFVDFTTSNTDNFKRISITDASDINNNIFIQLLGTAFAVQVISGGTTVYSWSFSITLSDRHKVALRYKDGDSQLYYNGTQQTATTTSGTWFTDGLLDTFSLNQGSFFNFYGEIYSTMIFNEALSDIELTELTS